jgi:sugar phosphate permease
MLALRYALPTIYRFPPITRVSQMPHHDQNDISHLRARAPTPPHSHGSERRIIDLPHRGFLPRMFERVGVHYGWAVTGVVFLTMLSTSAAMGMVGVLMLPLKTEFGWDLGAISGALALRVLLYGMAAPFAAAVMLRYGVRTVVGTALASIVIGLALATRITAVWQLWLTWGVIIGLSTGATANVLGATIATRWFTKRRGLVIGMLGASNATGQLLFLPLAAWLSEHYGWRYGTLPAGALCLTCLVLVLVVVRDYPASVGLPSYGESAVVPVPSRFSGGNALKLSFAALSVASGNRTFWILASTFFVCGLSTSGLVQNHFIPLCHDFGIDTIAASGVLATMGAFDFVGTIFSGWLSDRFDNRWLLFWYYGLRGLSLLVLPYTDFSLYGLSMFAVFYGLDWIATVPPTVKLTSRSFGLETSPLVFGWISLAHQMGSATAAYGAGASRDALLSYLPAFFAAGIACVVASIAILTIRKRSAEAILTTPAE